jgi:hypothetical protein
MNLRYVILAFIIVSLTIYALTHIATPVSQAPVSQAVADTTPGSIYQNLFKGAQVVGGATAIPPRPTYGNPGCVWEWSEAGAIGMWAEQCVFNGERWKLSRLAPATGTGLALAVDGRPQRIALQLFKKTKEQSIDAILPILHTLGVPKSECELVKNDAQSLPDRTVYEMVPTGARKQSFEKQSMQEVPEDPCGSYGVSAAGQRVFEVWTGHEEYVIFLNYGQDGSLFDYDSLSFI